ncbi:sensor histidine kinase [Paenibacillus piri]|uniref:histidine kinase n=1 Tax=Paenibacillus piri TaxID=2547395 RepID=A0A4V2ZTC6_9BACL|nr:sensor histidine kinase [Paenibacillus piri]TDF96604.1 two-component sensor histidine kinase [Paenibacillus piri]
MQFNYALNEFLLNVFFIMFPLIFYQFVIQEKMKRHFIANTMLTYLLFGLPMVLCMFFPIVKEEEFLFDLRVIPLLLGCFYGNLTTALMLFVTLVGSRFMLGGMGAYLNLISSSISFLIFISFAKRFHSLRLVHKIVFAAALSFICKLIGISSNLLFDPDYHIQYGIMFYLFQSVLMGLTIYIIESIVRSIQLRKDLMDAEKMKVASVISASVAHEIRNPLTAVRGFIQLLGAAQLDSDKKQLYSQICLEEIDRAQQIINDYLSLAKPHDGKIEKLDLGEEIQYVSNVLSSYANLKNVQVHIHHESNLYVLGDRQKFRQSIINISKNGIEAMGERGGILTLSVIEQKDIVTVLISDTGSGMTEDQIRRLGTPYYSTKDKGTGLGTMVAFHIIQSMMGKVDIKSQVGRGTEYNIVFPKA